MRVGSKRFTLIVLGSSKMPEFRNNYHNWSLASRMKNYGTRLVTPSLRTPILLMVESDTRPYKAAAGVMLPI